MELQNSIVDLAKLQETLEIIKAEKAKIIMDIVKKVLERKNSNADMRNVNFLHELKIMKEQAYLYDSLYVELLPVKLDNIKLGEEPPEILKGAAETAERWLAGDKNVVSVDDPPKRTTRTRRAKA